MRYHFYILHNEKELLDFVKKDVVNKTIRTFLLLLCWSIVFFIIFALSINEYGL